MNDAYLDYLCRIVGRNYGYEQLLDQLYGIEFYSLVANDDNREFDGLAFRGDFLEEMGPQGSFFLPDGRCSVLEMLIGVAKRLEFDLLGSRYERNLGDWFWVLIDNLSLEWYDETCYELTDAAEEEVAEKVHIFLERLYRYDGNGGLFPLKWPDKDQKEVEIWYQMSAWENENFPF